MKKIKLLYVTEPPFAPREFPWIKEQFDFVQFDSSLTRDKTDCVVVKSQDYNSEFTNFLLENQYKVIIEDLIDPMFDHNPNDHCLLLQNFFWYWYNENATFKDLGLKTYTPNRTYEKLAFCPMRLNRWFRDRLYDSLAPWHNDMIISYNARQIFLPGDKFDSNGRTLDRHFNPVWYDSTHFSIVLETVIQPNLDSDKFTPQGRVAFITEKTFKPMAFYHPFMLLACPGSLRRLKDTGFESYENLFDESYDQTSQFDKKISIVINNIKNFQRGEYNKLTLEKIQHNYDRFWNQPLVQQRMIAEIVEPILHYAETS